MLSPRMIWMTFDVIGATYQYIVVWVFAKLVVETYRST